MFQSDTWILKGSYLKLFNCLRYLILYHKSNLVYTDVFPQLLIFQKNNSAET